MPISETGTSKPTLLKKITKSFVPKSKRTDTDTVSQSDIVSQPKEPATSATLAPAKAYIPKSKRVVQEPSASEPLVPVPVSVPEIVQVPQVPATESKP